MKRSVVETVLGAVVLLGAIIFLATSYKTANVGDMGGYKVTADFSGIGGLKIGDDVQISGVKVGQIVGVTLDPKTFLARVTLDIGNSIQLPTDTAAMISSTSLLGGRFLSIEPGGAEEMIPPGGHIDYTQDPQNLEQLLGKFIFSMQGGKDKDKGAATAEGGAAPEPGAVETPAEPASP